MLTRRSLLGGILAAASGPLILRSGVARGIIMPVQKLILPEPRVLPFDTIYVHDSHGRTFTLPDGKMWAIGTMLTIVNNSTNTLHIQDHGSRSIAYGPNQVANVEMGAHGLLTGIKITDKEWCVDGIGLS